MSSSVATTQPAAKSGSGSDQKHHHQVHPHQRKPALDLRPSAIVNANLALHKAETAAPHSTAIKTEPNAHYVFRPQTGSNDEKRAPKAIPALSSASASKLVFVPRTTKKS
ncbi:MAG: hypothetical protein M1561_06540 [Gammaproteobacteria bacterium]|nr:hypothetical protein [Gammaproteobacteria bacterium]